MKWKRKANNDAFSVFAFAWHSWMIGGSERIEGQQSLAGLDCSADDG
jgi:hypothetical protein